MSERETVTIAEAAIRHGGKIYTGKRHAIIMATIWNSEIDSRKEPSRITQEEQGFVTNTGQFVNRWQAGGIAHRAGQTKVRHPELLSEHVW